MSPAEDWDALVVGAGPAGSVAAMCLARQGARVLIADRSVFPREKTCGCCLGRAGLELLEELGIAERPELRNAPRLERARLWARKRSLVGTWRGGVSLERSSLDQLLLDAARRSGASCALGAPCRFIAQDARHVRAMVGAAEVRASVVVAADGLAGSFTRDAGITSLCRRDSRFGVSCVLDIEHALTAPPSGEVWMSVARGGYVGVVRLAGSRLDVAAALDPAFTHTSGGPAPACERIMHDSGMPVPIGLARARWRGVGLLTRQCPRPESGRVIAAGDAAGYVEPITGAGMSWAIASGIAAADQALRAIRGTAHEGQWARQVSTLLRARRARTRLIARAMRLPRLVSGAIVVSSALPALQRAIAIANEPPWLTPRAADLGRREWSTSCQS